MQQFLGDPNLGILNLESHRLALAIAKKIMDENHYRTAQRTTDRQPLSFQIGDSIFHKTNSPANGTSNGDLDTELSKLSVTLFTYRKPGNWKNMIL